MMDGDVTGSGGNESKKKGESNVGNSFGDGDDCGDIYMYSARQVAKAISAVMPITRAMVFETKVP